MKKVLLYIPSVILFFLPYFFIVYREDIQWHTFLPYPVYLKMDTACVALFFALALSFCWLDYLKRIPLCLLFFGIGYLLAGIIHAITFIILILLAGFILTGGILKGSSFKKNIAIRSIRTFYGLIMFVVASALPLPCGCPFGAAFTQYVDTYLIIVYIPIISYIIFDFVALRVQSRFFAGIMNLKFRFLQIFSS